MTKNAAVKFSVVLSLEVNKLHKKESQPRESDLEKFACPVVAEGMRSVYISKSLSATCRLSLKMTNLFSLVYQLEVDQHFLVASADGCLKLSACRSCSWLVGEVQASAPPLRCCLLRCTSANVPLGSVCGADSAL